eukprot:13228287-Ditylum_brightwellii.AAC.1
MSSTIADRESRFIFDQIHPIIRLLLISITQNKVLVGEKRGDEEEKLLSNLRIQHDLLVKLTDVFESFHSAKGHNENKEAQGNNNSGEFSDIKKQNMAIKENALVNMAEYVLLPFTQILRGGIEHQQEQQQNYHSEEQETTEKN